jgi:hypothetical protein
LKTFPKRINFFRIKSYSKNKNDAQEKFVRRKFFEALEKNLKIDENKIIEIRRLILTCFSYDFSRIILKSVKKQILLTSK